MAATSEIAWTDATFNPWIGCTKVAPGCTHCYAESYAKRYGKADWGPNGTRVKTSEHYWRQPLKWNREAEAAGERRRVFCASLADVFEDWPGRIHGSKGNPLWYENGTGLVCEDVGEQDFAYRKRPMTMDDLRRDLFKLIDATPWLDWLLLTKRPENIRRMWERQYLDGGTTGRLREFMDPAESQDVSPYWRRNVWLLTSVSEQESYDRNSAELEKCRDLSPVLGLSAEPILGPIEFGDLLTPIKDCEHQDPVDGCCSHPRNMTPECHVFACPRPEARQPINWIIVGGESGHGARPCDLAWIRSIRDQCAAAGVACFVKQLGANAIAWDAAADGLGGVTGGGGDLPWPTDDKKGGDISEWPSDLRVRQFPQATTV